MFNTAILRHPRYNMRLFYGFVLILALSICAFAQNAKTAESFTAVDLKGSTVDLGALKGKVVVMTFWSTRCAICSSEIPKLNQMVETYRGKDVVFLGVTHENPEKIAGYLKAKPFNFEIIPNGFGILLKYADKDASGNINMGFPSHFVIDQNGEIAMKTNGFDKTGALVRQINRLLSETAAKIE